MQQAETAPVRAMKIAKLNFDWNEFAFSIKGIGRFNLQFRKSSCRAYMSIPVSKDIVEYLKRNNLSLTSLLPQHMMYRSQERIDSLGAAEMKKLYQILDYIPKEQLKDLPRHVKAAMLKKHIENYNPCSYYRHRVIVRVDLDKSLTERFQELLEQPYKSFNVIKKDVMLSIAEDALPSIIEARQLYLGEMQALEKVHNISSNIRFEKLQAKRDALDGVEIIIPEPVVVDNPPF